VIDLNCRDGEVIDQDPKVKPDVCCPMKHYTGCLLAMNCFASVVVHLQVLAFAMFVPCPRRYPTGGGGGGEAPEVAIKGDPALDQAYIQSLLNRPERMSWDEYKEKHKDQLSDRLGAGMERESLEYRKKLDQERNSKVTSP